MCERAVKSVAAVNPCYRAHHRYVTTPAAWAGPLLTTLPSAQTMTVYLDRWNVCFGGGGGWEFVSAWIRGRENTDCLRFCSCLANSRSFPHSHSSHTEQRETVAPSRRVKHDFLPFPPCSSAGWRKCISVRLTCQMEEIWMWHWRRWAASYEGPGDEAWRYGLLSGVENEVERSSRKRKAFPSGEQRHWANSILGQLCNVLVSLGLRTFQRWS